PLRIVDLREGSRVFLFVFLLALLLPQFLTLFPYTTLFRSTRSPRSARSLGSRDSRAGRDRATDRVGRHARRRGPGPRRDPRRDRDSVLGGSPGRRPDKVEAG